jgi:hypothetical protein
MYPMNLRGLIVSYIAGLPFLKNQLISVLVFTPAFAALFSLVHDKIFVREPKKHEDFAIVAKIS